MSQGRRLAERTADIRIVAEESIYKKCAEAKKTVEIELIKITYYFKF